MSSTGWHEPPADATRPPRGERELDLAETERLRRLQVFGAWCGPAFAVLLFGGWGLLAGFIPLISPHHTAAHVRATWSDHQVMTLVGLSLALIGITLTLPFFLTISTQMRRAERRLPYLSILQFAAGIMITLVLEIPMLLFVVGAFRGGRSPEFFQLINDASYILLILPWPPIVLQLVCIAGVTLRDDDRGQVFPRWYGYLNLWTAVLLTPANLIIFFKNGPFAWTGLVGFWIPAAVFGVWYLITCRVLLVAIGEEATRTRAGAAGGGPEVTARAS